MPDIGLADDGEANNIWDSGGNYVDLGFYGTASNSISLKVVKVTKFTVKTLQYRKDSRPNLQNCLWSD